MLDRVTITGADDAVDIGELCELASEFPFLELAILASVSRHGTPRYPTTGWVERFTDQRFPQSSIHLCGEYARNALDGNLSSIAQWFDRCQINFKIPPIRDAWTLSGVVWAHGETQFIFQHNDDNAEFLDRLGTKCNFSCLFDASGGRGVTPTEWPTGISSIGPYCGYAGGLSPDNLERELPRIAAARGPANFWVDVESGVRTEDRFDLAKVRRVLEIAKGHMEQMTMPIEIKDGYGRLMGIRGDNLGHDDLIAQGMFERRDDQWTDADRVLLPAEFSLSCTECDDGSHIQSIEHAKAEGWAEVFFDPGGCSWNYLGLCPACKAREVARVS